MLASMPCHAEETSVSYAGILAEKYSVLLPGDSLPEAVRELMKVVAERYPETRQLKIEYINSDKRETRAALKGARISLQDKTLSKILEDLGSTFGHQVEYRFLEDTIRFEAVFMVGGEKQRTYYISEANAKKLKLDWSSAENFYDTLGNAGFMGDMVSIDKERNAFVVKGSKGDLDRLDMLIYAVSELK